MTKECECSAHSAVECCCGAWDEPQRTWIGLTIEDIDKAIEDNQRIGGFRKVGFAYDLEAILKEKNT